MIFAQHATFHYVLYQIITSTFKYLHLITISDLNCVTYLLCDMLCGKRCLSGIFLYMFLWLIKLNLFIYDILFVYSSANVSPSISARPESRWATPAGSYTAWSTASSLTDRCPVTRQSEAAMTLSTRSSARREQGNTCQEPCLSIWSPL